MNIFPRLNEVNIVHCPLKEGICVKTVPPIELRKKCRGETVTTLVYE